MTEPSRERTAEDEGNTRGTDVELVGDAVTINVARAALFAALIGAFSYVSFPNPVSPTPVTLQVLGVFLAGIFLGPIWGGTACVLYIVAGILGAPVFAGGAAGFGVLVGPTAGYLWSMPVAAFTVGMVVHGGFTPSDPKSNGPIRLVSAMVAGTVLIYATGVIGMMFTLDLALSEAFITGAVVLVPAEVLKIAAAVGIVRSDAITAS
ncbi:biotin transporter BioY [Halocatena pleomorpha]|uniref:Biotin transporter BioY n=1 Tax=Halocatena pleomorpha TaxID=1785090 RepID=A0A3P3RDG8_9EURY|nr:biotin transporter BioY [Halocatena pleomorpha]RRJ31542.1 biotin transporter BioY [Halocatena pleomorpha]